MCMCGGASMFTLGFNMFRLTSRFIFCILSQGMLYLCGLLQGFLFSCFLDYIILSIGLYLDLLLLVYWGKSGKCIGWIELNCFSFVCWNL